VIGEAHLSDEHLDRLVGLGGRRLLISRQLMIQRWTGWGLRLAVSARSIISWTWPSWSMLRRLSVADEGRERHGRGGSTLRAMSKAVIVKGRLADPRHVDLDEPVTDLRLNPRTTRHVVGPAST
jgi:hypothetical protein